MLLPYVCLRCRQAVRRDLGKARQIQARPYASFISFREPSARLASTATPSALAENAETLVPKQSRGKGRAGTLERKADASTKFPGRDDFLEKLFASSSRGEADVPANQPPDHRPQMISSRTRRSSPLTELEALLSDPTKSSLGTCWAHFNKHYAGSSKNHLTHPSVPDRLKLAKGHAFRSLLRASIERQDEAREEVVPSPANAIQVYLRLGLMRESYWTETIWRLVLPLLDPSLEAAKPRDDGQVLEETSLDHLMEVWKVFFDAYRPHDERREQEAVRAIPAWPVVEPGELERVRGRFSKSLQTRFFHFFPRFPPSREMQAISLGAAATFDLLTRSRGGLIAYDAAAEDVQPFMFFMGQVLPYAEHTHEALAAHLALHGIESTDVAELVQWHALSPRALAMYASSKTAYPGAEGQGTQAEVQRLYLRRIGRALFRKDVVQAEALWAEAQQYYTESSTASRASSPPSLPIELYNRFIHLFMALGRGERAIGVWNEMRRRGIEPTQASWHAMLDGCRKARDPQSLLRIWEQMTAEGVSPDVGCWTTIIHGFFAGGKWRMGVQALHTMGEQWTQAARKSDSRAAKPNTETINATISGLLRFHQPELARQVLAWASELGIPADVVTYNTLLRPTIREGRADEAAKLLAEMERNQVRPDVVTFTILLDGRFRSLHSSSPSPSRSSSPSTSPSPPATSETDTVLQMLHAMERSGISANAHSYSVLLDGLLQQHGNVRAAKAVLSHMTARNLSPSPHIYTILATYYFRAGDVAALAALWARMQLSDDAARVDLIFLERMVEGYARLGEIGAMRDFAARITRRGIAPTWRLLRTMLEAYVRAGDAGGAQALVVAVRARKGIYANGNGPRGWTGQSEFWDLVERAGVGVGVGVGVDVSGRE